MTDAEKRAREAIVGLGERGRTQRIPVEVREVVVEFARRERHRGRSWADIADRIGVSTSALIRWAQGRRPKQRKVVPVAVREHVAADAAPVVLVTPGGYRIEGVSVEQTVDLMRRLS